MQKNSCLELCVPSSVAFTGTSWDQKGCYNPAAVSSRHLGDILPAHRTGGLSTVKKIARTLIYVIYNTTRVPYRIAEGLDVEFLLYRFQCPHKKGYDSKCYNYQKKGKSGGYRCQIIHYHSLRSIHFIYKNIIVTILDHSVA